MTPSTGEYGALEADRIYCFRDIADRADVSLSTLQRVIRAGQGPVVTQISANRKGIRGRHAAAWLDARASKSAA